MKKNETKIFDTAFQGIVAVITVRKKGNTYHFTGKLANKFGGVLTEYTPCRRTEKVKNDWPYREIVNALEKKIRKKHKPVIPGKKPDNAAPLSPEAQNIQKAFSKVKAMNPEEIYDNWIRSTATSALKYFERHILSAPEPARRCVLHEGNGIAHPEEDSRYLSRLKGERFSGRE